MSQICIDGAGDPRVPILARVSLVDYRGAILLDEIVQPTQAVVDYRTAETGCTPATFSHASPFLDTQSRVAQLIANKILVGHRLWDALSVLHLSHPAVSMRDMALFPPLRRSLQRHAIVDLSTLISAFMGRQIGRNPVHSVEQARAVMDLFRSCESTIENRISTGEWPFELAPPDYAAFYT
ncbi:hypothetical protein CYLTODRAFT_454307 [Cylindrobasidium torrendii FP15055 ss-10]|uniref:Exonuclease domain-containing protein n=1 Tax=Cylindrobasidium torrendii FP15055 ss-10 TaxID=1314674 RepID=A0A0D7BBF2_9AGAR|nr:hypothetical protein CYLTODRAFT_454307 [Cylindrobasidium torrendii FP15055 ss-10]